MVVPTYNEALTVSRTLRRLRNATGAAVLVVDDSSPDGTAQIVEALGDELGGIEILCRPAKGGLGPAYRAGFGWGLEHGFDVMMEMDADGSHDPADIPHLLGALSSGVELVIGSRYVPGGSLPAWALHRLALSRLGNAYTEVALGLGVSDATSGFRAYAASLLGRIDMAAVGAGGYGFQIEMTRKARQAGATIVEIPICFVDRTEGCSKMSGQIVSEALWLVTKWGVVDRWSRLRARTARPPDVSAVADDSGN